MRGIVVAVGVLVSLLSVIVVLSSAFEGHYPEAYRLAWSPAPGPVEWYEACMEDHLRQESCGRVPRAWELRVRGCRLVDEEADCGPWSPTRGIIAVPEPGGFVLLAAGVVGLSVLRRFRA